MTSTLSPDWASAAATFTVVVVLPTPPFWLATVSTRVEAGVERTGDPSPDQLRSGAAGVLEPGVCKGQEGVSAP